MSHFCGLVILTPDCTEFGDWEDSIAKFSEHLEMPEYSTGEVSDMEKLRFLKYYKEKVVGDRMSLCKTFYDTLSKKDKKKAFEAYKSLQAYPKLNVYSSTRDWDRYYSLCFNSLEEEAVAWFKKEYPKVWKSFAATYKKYGDEWNCNEWRKVKGVWQSFSTYNPDSKWDWYELGGRWYECIKTKEGKFVNECSLGEMDFTPFKDEDYEDGKNIFGKPCKQLKDGIRYHYTSNSVPFCIVVDGLWIERGSMGWWCQVANKKEAVNWNEEIMNILNSLPADSEVYNVDFHI